MARAHGRILSRIWEDQAFTALDPEVQRMYMFLLSQATLSHAGLLPITLRRWASKTAGTSPARVAELLRILDRTGFVVVDEDSEELLVRTLIRNDGIWRQPNVMSAAVAAAAEISSVRLRRALAAEMARLPLEQLADEPSAKGGPSVRAQVRAHVEQMIRVLDVPAESWVGVPGGSGTAPDPLMEPLPRGSQGLPDPSGTLPDPSGTAPEPSEKGSDNPSGGVPTRARTRADSPTPSPTPAPTRERAASGQPSAPAAAPRPDGRSVLPEDFALSDAMRRWAVATVPQVDVDFETQQFLSHYRADGGRRRSWPDQWQKWMRQAAKYQADRAAKQPPLLAAVPGTGPRALTGTDATVAGWFNLDLKESS